MSPSAFRLPPSPFETPSAFPQTALDFFEQTYRLERLAASPPTTLEQYRIALNHLARFRSPASQGAPLLVEDFSRQALLECRAGLLAAGDSKATANKYCRHQMAVWRCAHELGFCSEPPSTIKKLKEEKRSPRAWTIDELGLILDCAGRAEGQICGLRACSWWTAIFLTLYDTGLRISTVMALRWAHFDARRGELCVPAGIVKDQEELVLALSVQTLAALAALRGSGAAEIFPWPFDRDHHWRVLRKHQRKILAEAGLTWKKREGGFHQYRRTTASYLRREGGDPTEHLGHSTPAVTRCYLDKRICKPRRQVDFLPRPKLAETADADRQLTLF